MIAGRFYASGAQQAETLAALKVPEDALDVPWANADPFFRGSTGYQLRKGRVV